MKALFLSVILLAFVGCKSSKSSSNVSTTNIDNFADTVEVSLLSVAGVTDDASNESVVAQSSPGILENILNHALINTAYAATCSRTLSNASGVCTRNVNCEVGAYVWSGTAILTFSNGTNCSLGATSEYFTRTVDFTRSGPRGSLQTTSSNRTAYDGTSIGGGIRVTSDGGTAVDVDILGQHKILTRTGGTTVFDMSFTTPTALQLNQLARNGRVISSGDLEVHHNRAQFTALHTVSNLTYSSSCCYPVSGSMTSTFSGSISGTGSVTFTSCGNFTATYNGQSKAYSMTNCE